MLNNIEAPETRRVSLLHTDGTLYLLRLHELNPERYPHLLQSTAPGQQANYDILFAYPEATHWHSQSICASTMLQAVPRYAAWRSSLN